MISVSLAIVAMVIGLTMKYSIEEPILEAQIETPEVELVSFSDSIKYEIEEIEHYQTGFLSKVYEHKEKIQSQFRKEYEQATSKI